MKWAQRGLIKEMEYDEKYSKPEHNAINYVDNIPTIYV